MIKKFEQNKERGFAMMMVIIIILSVSLIIGLGISFLIYDGIMTTNNKVKSIQSYYTAEAGIEDSLLRLKNGLNIVSPNTLDVGNSSASVEVSADIGGSRTIISEGNSGNRIRKVTATYAITTDEINFFYGAQAGDGGIKMGNNSRIEGNVFSNGSILPLVGGTSDITGTVTIAGNGNKIDSVNVGEDVYVHSCKDSSVTGTLNYVSGGSLQNCTAGTFVDMGPNEIDDVDLPLTLAQINDWKNDAAAGGTMSGDYTLDLGATDSLGPVKITGNLLIDNNSVLIMTGIIYVEGDITVQNNSILQLVGGYELLSGVILSDGKILIQNNAILQGSGQTGSFLMLLSTNDSVDPASPAINVDNNAEGAVFYTSAGAILLNNNVEIREATGYKLILNNNAEIEYEVGLANVNFSSGPGGGWQITNWQEIE